MRTITQIQQDYMETVNCAKDRWSHRRDGGHSQRTIGAAIKRAKRDLAKLGLSESLIAQSMQDANDMIKLERAAVEDDLNFA